MGSQIIGFTNWFKTPPGEYLLAWERERFDEAVADMFGYHALQLGLPELDALRSNRMPHKWLALQGAGSDLLAGLPASGNGSATPIPAASSPRVALLTHSAALPFPENSLDLVLLPHTLELSSDPHATLREVERVLVPEGRVVISGLNPASLWGLRQRRAHFYRRLGYGELFLPEAGEFIGYWRLRDWLRLLSFEVESSRFGCYRPAVSRLASLERFAWMDKAGERWWPIFGAMYFLVAVKRVRGMRLLEPNWKTQKATAQAPAVIANQVRRPESF
ncbi:MAG: methyltransferase domain-containing protein [Polaromonas sp.]|uniref:class I SAM-dependent methyltransferase n=1 Tax=Polaromonas sp. TaxID=1869339 RepID=UPI0024880C95|nr:methyltransferase domain-containing protein [Polaromonas sp.]MDI1239109.1 methyltransferase domain-containing protein [Polaromonas sp.]MDI1342145.1 methyltransferase domain-containing protein [Polaromonas sp.]